MVHSIKLLFTGLLAFAFIGLLKAQNPGDTIKVRPFFYGSPKRDTVANFPTQNLSFERIMMRYSMRCKNALVSDQNDRNKGCGEWDYSCNTFIVDSSKIEKEQANQPNYVISNFNGTTYPYTTQAVYDYLKLPTVSVQADVNATDTAYLVINGSKTFSNFLYSGNQSGKTQFILTATELTAAGLSAGEINALTLHVNNAGGNANFFNVKIKSITQNNILANAPHTNGFTQVYNNHYSFVNGSNKIFFSTPYNWNGSSNLLVELSYTNSTALNPVAFTADSGDVNLSIVANNNYAVDLADNGNVNINSPLFSTIQNEITIGLWAYGHANQMPASTSVLYGYQTNADQRQVNIHLPWNNNKIYFDCGNVNGYDRIEKDATTAEQGGQWNYWVFTKNAATGSMKIYLNGALWLSGTGKSKPIALANLILGNNNTLTNNYKGKINELSIWDKELTAAEIAAWINKPIDSTHIRYNNLLAYFPMFDVTAQSIVDVKNNQTYNGNNLQWTFDRGDKLIKGFSASATRPNVTLHKGNYQITTTNTYALDSTVRKTNYITKYAVISKEGAIPFTNDSLAVVETITNYTLASPSKVWNENNQLIDSIANNIEGTLSITNLSYFKRYPFYNEIMSFVTPYGIGLDLGPKGKDWYFDVTDFTPLLKGNKRILMSMGGQNQEENEIEFYFIVGTPAKNVLEFNQIWQGPARLSGVSIKNINNNVQFAPATVPTLANGKSFKIRSTITGHGAEGEFEANGGEITHSLKINNNAPLNWRITQNCSFNPVFPQGGTWIYDREGWCPGEASLLHQEDITKWLTPGTSFTVDYNTSAPPNTNGDYRYLVAHQLITYGSPNFTKDVRIKDIIKPNNLIVHGRINPMCANPEIVIENTGSADVTSVSFEYWVNEAGAKQTYTWNGALKAGQEQTIILPALGVWDVAIAANDNKFSTKIVSVDGSADEYLQNNILTSTFNRPEVIPGKFSIEVRTNNRPQENSYTLYDANGLVVDQKNFTTANTITKTEYNLGGCYTLVFDDLGSDGISWWGNSSTAGSGFIRLRNESNQVIKTFQPDFGERFVYSFTTKWALSAAEIEFGSHINLYPNPTKGNFMLEGFDLENATFKVVDLLGREVNIEITREANVITFSNTNLNTGVYFVVISKNNLKAVKKIVIH